MKRILKVTVLLALVMTMAFTTLQVVGQSSDNSFTVKGVSFKMIRV